MSLEPSPAPLDHSTLLAVARPSKAASWTGWVLSAVPILMMGVGGVGMAVSGSPKMREGMAHLGYPDRVAPIVLALEVGCAVVYAIPQTAVLGAILMTAYLGGAVASHVRLLERDWVGGVVFGVVAWLGLYLRDPRVRALVPLRRA